MKRERVFGLMFGLIVLCIVFVALGSTTPQMWYWWPIEAINGIAFALAFGLGCPVWLSYILAALSLLCVFYIGFKLGSNLARIGRR